jgi:uncharacterized protein YqjF (DUF2071 family)
MHQRWEDLLFLHWPVAPDVLRPLIPHNLELDTFEGQAYIGVTPFHLEDVRPPLLPALPWISSFDEINVRTYVLHNGRPGIWFFSLDASKVLPVIGGRVLFNFPYFKATTQFDRQGQKYRFKMKRVGNSAASCHLNWQTTGTRLRAPDLKSLAFFLVERYCAFSVENSIVSETRIYHHPWILEEAVAEVKSSTLISSLGLLEPAAQPLVYFSKSLDVEIWPPVKTGLEMPV